MVSIRQWITVLASTLLLTGCERSQDAGKTPADEALAPSEILPVDPPLDREGLLRAVGRAASDFASGLEDRDRQLQLDGRLFEVRLRFGCAGDAIETREWSFDEGQRVLRVRVEPELTSDSAALEALNLEGFEAVEGFWIRRPWLLEAACPAVREISPAADATAAPDPAAQPAADTETDPDADNNALSPRVGIAHFSPSKIRERGGATVGLIRQQSSWLKARRRARPDTTWYSPAD